MVGLELIDAQVRDAVRRRGIDPASDPGAVRGLVEEIVRAYDERSLTGAVPVLDDLARTTQDVYDAVAGYGPLQRYFDDPTVEEIWINEPGRVFIARHGRTELTTTILTAQAVRDLVERMLKPSGRRLDLSSPFVDALLPDGSRLHVVIPDITRAHWAVNIRKFVVRAHHLDELVELGSVTAQAAAFLEAAVAAGLNIVVAGGTQAGKTTLLNCLGSAIPARERVVVCEEVFELPITPTVHMCRQSSISARVSTATAWARRCRASVRTASGLLRLEVGRYCGSTSTTTHRRPAASLDRPIGACSPTLRTARSRS